MREILFRGRRKGGNEWLIGDLNHIDGLVYIFPRTEDTPLNSPDWFEVDEETVGQFINLKDKNKNPIYEGDIISHATNYLGDGRYGSDFVHKPEKAEVVKFEGGCFCISTGATVEEFIYNIVHHRVEAEIIGTIHTHPELLK